MISIDLTMINAENITKNPGITKPGNTTNEARVSHELAVINAI